MRKPPPVDPSNPAALATWLSSVRGTVEVVKAFLLDATLPHKERVHARKYLRRFGLRRLHDLESQLAAIDPTPPQGDTPAPSEPAPSEA
jgi:hypothetical protein